MWWTNSNCRTRHHQIKYRKAIECSWSLSSLRGYRVSLITCALKVEVTHRWQEQHSDSLLNNRSRSVAAAFHRTFQTLHSSHYTPGCSLDPKVFVLKYIPSESYNTQTVGIAARRPLPSTYMRDGNAVHRCRAIRYTGTRKPIGFSRCLRVRQILKGRIICQCPEIEFYLATAQIINLNRSVISERTF